MSLLYPPILLTFLGNGIYDIPSNPWHNAGNPRDPSLRATCRKQAAPAASCGVSVARYAFTIQKSEGVGLGQG